MALMYPNLIEDTKSNAEKCIFQWLRDDPKTNDWIVLHSYPLFKHETLIIGEADFVVLAPNLGVFVLEVKGGLVERKGGVWYFTGKKGTSEGKKRGPFDQGEEGVQSVMKMIKEKFGSSSLFGRLHFGYGCVFPDMVFDYSSPEFDPNIIFDQRNGTKIGDFVIQLSHFWQKKYEEKNGQFSKSKLPDKKQVLAIRDFLRPNFESLITLKKVFDSVDRQIERLTEEQYYILDGLEDNKRALVLGSAGTGKTLLAVQAMLKRVKSGNMRIGFFCFNKHLGDYLKERIDPVLPKNGSFVGTIHSYICSFLFKKGIISAKDLSGDYDFYAHTLPNIFVENYNSDFSFEYFDLIIVDEVQDLVTDDYLLVFECILRDGFSKGRWLFFGDFENQDINSKIHYTEEEARERVGNPALYRLTINCRNTLQICNEIRNIANVNYKTVITQIEGSPVDYLEYSSDSEGAYKFDLLIEKLKKEKIRLESIVVLSPKKKDNSFVELSKFKIIDYPNTNSDKGIVFSTIQSFKGLESQVVILVDVDSYTIDKLLYVGFSRAKAGLYVFETPSAHEERLRKVVLKYGRS